MKRGLRRASATNSCLVLLFVANNLLAQGAPRARALDEAEGRATDLTEGTVLPSYGGGLRFLVFDEQRLVVRVDYGHGDEDGQIYFSVSEAF